MRGSWLLSAVILMMAPAAAQTDSPWLNWVAENSPDGFDITPDGNIWINVGKPGYRDDYAVLADDLKAARDASSKNPEFWVRGYHKRNPSVRYRTSKTRYRLDCVNERITRLAAVFNDANGDVVGEAGYGAQQYIIPGSYGQSYYQIFCLG